ncbi:MAG TPA: sugar transferase [Acidisarcina sp.]
MRRFSSHRAISTWLSMFADGVAVLFALIVSLRFGLHRSLYYLAISSTTSYSGISHTAEAAYLAWFIATLLVVSRSYGLYRPMQLISALHEQRMTVQATLAAGLLLCGALYVTHGETVSRAVVIFLVCITCGILCLRRAIWRSMTYRNYELGLETRNMVIIGSNRVSDALRKHIVAKRHLGYKFQGFVYLSKGLTPPHVPQHEALGSVSQLRDIARQHFIDEVVVAEPCSVEQIIEILEEARELDLDVYVLPGFHDFVTVNAPIEYLGDFPVVSLHRRNSPVIALIFKRIFDVVTASTILLLSAPAMLAIAIAVRIDSPGPIFYASERVGKKGCIFRCYKFRTMVQDADKLKASLASQNERSGILFKMKDDPRVTTVGRWLRKYSLDELPQLFNVFRGEMSLVGPRPPIASEVERYEIEHFRRLEVTPGLTGLWQVQARSDPSFERYIALDTAYVENWSFWLDLKLLVMTAGVVLKGTGA